MLGASKHYIRVSDAITLSMETSRPTADPFVAGCLERLEEVWRYVRACTGSLHDTEDITHDIFVQACATRHQFNGGNMSAWLHQIARSRVALHYRRKQVEQRAQKTLESASDGAAVEPAAHDAVENPELLRAALLELDETEREALRLKFSLSYSNSEIARLLRVDPSYLGVIVFRALKKLRRKLEGKGL
jgi:RNA polymerase sigma factor (sigma-70 family)